MRAVIFANGVLSDPIAARAALQPGDLLIAADGGAMHLQALGLAPHVLIGDFDSLGQEQLQALEQSGARLIRHPSHKDYTDLELALQYARDQGAGEILVYGALGARWDQTLANLLLPAASYLAPLLITLVDGLQEILLLRSGGQLEVHGQPGDTLSLIPLGGDAHGVTTYNLEYPLQEETLLFGGTRGISNVLLGESASVSLETGLLVCVLIHQV